MKRSIIVLVSCLSCLSCKKQHSTAAPRTVLTGYYSIVGLYAIGSNNTYTPKQAPGCLQDFSLYLGAQDHMQWQDACNNVTGKWTYINNVLTVKESNGTIDISGSVEFESDGITLDVNNSVDNTRYRLWRN